MPPRRGRPRKSAPPSPVPEASEEEVAAPPAEPPQAVAEEFQLPGTANEGPEVATFELPSYAEQDPAPPPPPEPPVFAGENPFAALPTGPVPMDVSTEIAARRKGVIAKLRRYKTQFLALQAFPINEAAPLEQLEGTLETFRHTVGSKTTVTVFKASYITAIRGLERAASSIGGRCNGSADILGKSEQVDTILRIILAEYGVGERMSPVTQLAFVTGATMLAAHALNAKAAALQNLTARQADATLQRDFADL